MSRNGDVSGVEFHNPRHPYLCPTIPDLLILVALNVCEVLSFICISKYSARCNVRMVESHVRNSGTFESQMVTYVQLTHNRV